MSCVCIVLYSAEWGLLGAEPFEESDSSRKDLHYLSPLTLTGNHVSMVTFKYEYKCNIDQSSYCYKQMQS